MHLVVLSARRETSVRDMKRWRHRLLSWAGKLISSGRQTRLLIPQRAPEAGLFTTIGEHCKNLQHQRRQGQLVA